MHDYLYVLRNYAVFSGRARRQEYWLFTLFNIIITAVLGTLDAVLGTSGLLTGLYVLAILVPALAVSVRRLHDTDRSAWWLLIGLIPLVGAIVLIVFAATEGSANPNRWGHNPKYAPAA
ncbi:DUF805 domain-containing protein [Streptomyces bambusae]|uniref:DUF805 domain-containing protein n=1 Tax=Streptomyces bambusae TaxID=1550616 RepID=A0ABS6Z145_9ACTN|nr:DUF805 domain-containing protein [Streptomyces bambusae]MBW5481463.1 DUF805 domain-containing protein [Streptomyces bambusae]